MSPATTACALTFVAGLLLGGGAVHGLNGAQLAAVQTAHADAQRSAAEAAVRRLSAAQARGDALTADLIKARDEATALQEQLHEALARETAGRPCLGSAAVGVLNGTKAPAAAAVPKAGSEPVPADATFATDTDVGTWIAHAQRSYDVCNGRLGAIADFYKDFPSE